MSKDRTVRLNSLLKEVLSEVIRRDVKHPDVSELLTITRVAITKDLRHAKVYVSIIGDDKQRDLTMRALEASAGYIAVNASKKVVMRFFPALKFIFDDSAEKHMELEKLIYDIQNEREQRLNSDEQTPTDQDASNA